MDAAYADLLRLLTDRELEIRLLRRERRLLIDMDQGKARLTTGLLSGRPNREDLEFVQRTQGAIEGLHQEAAGGVARPDGSACACLLCAPRRDLRKPAEEVAWTHQNDAANFGNVLPCGDPACRHPDCPSGYAVSAGMGPGIPDDTVSPGRARNREALRPWAGREGYCPRCGYPGSIFKGIYRKGKPCDFCSFQEEAAIGVPFEEYLGPRRSMTDEDLHHMAGECAEREAVLRWLEGFRQGLEGGIDEADVIATAIHVIRAGDHHTGAPGNSREIRTDRAAIDDEPQS